MSSTDKGGRPSELSKEVLAKCEDYLRQAQDSFDTQTNKPVVNLPSLEGLALYLGVSRKTLYNWKEYGEKEDATDIQKQFLYIFERLLASQSNRLLNNGLSGVYNPTITKLLLSKHGYVEKQEVDQNLSGDVQFINQVPRPKND